ncbi:MAG TPA: hypothetical protein PKV73_00930 [Agriterribacter sp.]|nr:hypothetical protein [Agriterribacter sp.]
MNTKINFAIQGRHENHKGSAAIISRNSTFPFGTLTEMAKEAFESDDVKINQIGTAEQMESDGYIHVYDIYEAYQDSGSDDYQYFAINIGCYEE